VVDIIIFVAVFASAATLIGWITRVYGPFSGWSESAQCQRCGFVLHRFYTPVWSDDKTCKRCGPNSTWKRVVARPVGLFGYEVKEWRTK